MSEAETNAHDDVSAVLDGPLKEQDGQEETEERRGIIGRSNESANHSQNVNPLKKQRNEVAPDFDTDEEFDAQLCAARGGCRETQGRILESLQTYLMILARSRVPDGDPSRLNPSDLVQSCNLKALSSFQSFQGTTKGEFQAWLKTILVNSLATQRKLRQRPIQQTKLDHSAWGPLLGRMGHAHTDNSTPSSTIIRSERETRLREIVATLPEQYQQVIILHQFQKLTFPEIAEQIGCSANAACRTWMRALQELGKRIGPRREW